jgi:ABC-type multidrug transport system permease subunit
LAPSAYRFFIFFGYMVLMSQMALALFRVIGALTRNFDIANSYGSTALVVLLLLAGFILNKNHIHPWWIWLFWWVPLHKNVGRCGWG